MVESTCGVESKVGTIQKVPFPALVLEMDLRKSSVKDPCDKFSFSGIGPYMILCYVVSTVFVVVDVFCSTVFSFQFLFILFYFSFLQLKI